MPNHRKPTERKIIDGTFRKDRAPENEPKPPPVFEPPKPLSHLNKWAKAKWRELAQQLFDDGLLTVLDTTTLEVLCVNYGIYRELHDAIHRPPELDEEGNPTGRRRKRTLAEYMAGRNSQTMPEYTAMTKAFQTYKSLMAEFGLSPAARGRINVPKPAKQEDPMERLLNEA